MSNRRRTLVALLVSSALTACASGGASTSVPANAFTSGAPGAGAPVSVEVRNDNFYDVVVYAIRSGVMTRIGTVAGHGKEMLKVSAAFVSQGVLQFVAHPIGTAQQTTLDGVMVSPGQQVSLVLMPVITQSYAVAR